MVTHHPAECAAALRTLSAELRALLDGTTADESSRDWCADASELGQIVRQATWARDAVIVLARANGVPWAQLERHTGEPDSTLSGRFRRFVDREQT